MLIINMQFLKEKQFKQTIPQVKIEDSEEISYEKATTALRRSVNFFAALQASDGHWPAENAGPMYFMQPLVMCLYITGHLDTVFPAEYRKEILRYLYCHQVTSLIYFCDSIGLSLRWKILKSTYGIDRMKMVGGGFT